MDGTLSLSLHRRGRMDLTPGEDVDLGFQVIRVKDAGPGEAKVRLTAYYSKNGNVSGQYDVCGELKSAGLNNFQSHLNIGIVFI